MDYKKRDEIKEELTRVLIEHKQQENNKLFELCRDIDDYISKGHTNKEERIKEQTKKYYYKNKEAIEYTIDRYGNK